MDKQTKTEEFRKWLDEETNYSEAEKEDLVDGYKYGFTEGYELSLKDLRSARRENLELKLEKREKENNSAEVLENRGKFIDWMIEHYPEVVKEYLGF